ncbi:hypothetical protein JYP52_23000, partial [Nitratireductor aquibiodomus]|uniref:hypothetical protein n=1 Tax=Nitratireductor aquibiodomus TaxID=204799 RepID=UPI0019D3C6F0
LPMDKIGTAYLRDRFQNQHPKTSASDDNRRQSDAPLSQGSLLDENYPSNGVPIPRKITAGYFEKRDSGHTKDLHEMTPEEIGRELRRLESMARGETGGGKDDGGVFD